MLDNEGLVETYLAPDRTQLYYRCWPPTSVSAPNLENNIACIYTHGGTTHSLWFSDIARSMSQAGVTIYEVASDPQVQAREMIIDLQHPTAGKVRQVGVPFKFEGEAPGLRRFSPMNGEHTEEVLESLGYSLEQVEKLREEGAVK